MSIPTGHMITVAKLRELLAHLPDDSFVILQKDSEGNGYSPLAGAEAFVYQPTSGCRGESVGEDEDREDYPGAMDAVVLYPNG